MYNEVKDARAQDSGQRQRQSKKQVVRRTHIKCLDIFPDTFLLNQKKVL